MKKFKNTPSKAEAVKPVTVAKPDVLKAEPAKTEPIPVQRVKIVTAKPAVKPAPVSDQPKIGHVSFELVKPGAKQVSVAGSFNDWRPEVAPLVPQDNGRWVGDLTIKPGRYEYLFVVDGQWIPDPNAKESVQNPFGGRNSILGVSE